MSIKMRFIGQDGSLGLRYGRVYDAELNVKDNLVWVEWKSGRCPYDSITNFLANWNTID